MDGMIDWKKNDAENALHYDEMCSKEMKRSGAARDFWTSVRNARNNCIADGLMPYRNEWGELRYTSQQGLRAACLAREDAAVVSHAQLAILKRLDRNRNYMIGIIVLLLYIAYTIR